MNITHYDLFAGIGGFSLALEEVFNDATIRHIFCEWESFPTAVLKRYWPDGEFYGDIKDLVDHTEQQGLEGHWTDKATEGRQEPAGSVTEATGGTGSITDATNTQGRRPPKSGTTRDGRSGSADGGFTIVTGGFPCQPFSHAGRRKGTADDRYQWPNMFAVVRNTKPEWVIAENVRGLVTWNDGMVLETVCADLESEGYEVQPFIIPAVAVGAPHRRDRVWIIGRNSANADGQRVGDGLSQVQSPDGEVPERHDHAEPSDTGGHTEAFIEDAGSIGRRGRGDGDTPRSGRPLQAEGSGSKQYPDWSRSWQEVAFSTCDDAVDDGIRGRLVQLPDGTTLTYPKWRQNALKAFGNGIVPQVAMNIMQAIKEAAILA